jgi:hypothetical protein
MVGAMEVPEEIECVDCGQPAYRLSYPSEEGWQAGDYVAYRCSGCNDRWDMVVSDENDGDDVTSSHAAEARAILQARQSDPS